MNFLRMSLLIEAIQNKLSFKLFLTTKKKRRVLHPDVFWYSLNGMGAQRNMPKKVTVTLFPYIFHVKAK